MTSLPIMLLALCSSAAPGSMLFGTAGSDWVVLNSEGHATQRMRTIGGHLPLDAALSADGSRWAVVSNDAGGRPSLYLFTAQAPAEQRVVHSKGNVLDGVGFSPDGEWVYFSANDPAQPRFDGQPMVYAQVWRTRFSGGDAEGLSMSRGCHMWPRPASARFVAVAHATCTGGRSLELLNLKTRREEVLIPPTANVAEVAVDSAAERVFYITAAAEGYRFHVMSLKSRTTDEWGATFVRAGRTRPQWVDESQVFFQNGDAVWRCGADGQFRQLLSLREAS